MTDRLLHWESHLFDNKGLFFFFWTKLCCFHGITSLQFARIDESEPSEQITEAYAGEMPSSLSLSAYII